jgi:hypothetical protein
MKVNKERDDAHVRLLYTEVPLNRQHMTRRILDMATFVSALSPQHMEALYRYVDFLQFHPFDYNDDNVPDVVGSLVVPVNAPYSPTAAIQLHLLYDNEDVQM